MVLPSVIVERARKEAKKLGISLEEYLLEPVSYTHLTLPTTERV